MALLDFFWINYNAEVPVVFKSQGSRFFFYSNEGDPREPLHVHIRKGECLAKIWLKPRLEVAECYGFNAKEINGLLRLVKQNAVLIERTWNEYFQS